MNEKAWNQLIRCSIFFATLLILGACTVNRSSPTRFYVLSTLTDLEKHDQTYIMGKQLHIGIAPVDLPIYLDRPQIVTRRSANEIELQEFNRWGEPLADGIFRVISENLSNLLSSRLISVSNWEGSRSIDYLIMLEVIRLDGDMGKDIVLIANWSILDQKGGKVLLADRSDFIEPSGTADYESFVRAQSRAIGRLSQKIAEGILSLSKGTE